MITKTINLYQFDELSDAAKEKAREWWRQCESQEFGRCDDLNDSAEISAKLLGIVFKTHAVRLINNTDRYEPNIWWQLEGQGQGASFEGTYYYAKGSVKAMAKEFPKDAELQRIARELASLQKKHRYNLTATIGTNSRRSVHKMAMFAEVSGTQDVTEEDSDELLELMRDFADWIFKGLQEEYEYRMSEENVDDAIKANEYTFTEDGTRED